MSANAIVAAFGKNLAGAVSVTDLTGESYQASVVYESPSQINFIMPADLEAGPATVAIGSGSTAQSAAVVIAPTAPSLFTMNVNGLAAAYVTSAASGGGLTNQPVFTVQNGVITAVPIDVSSGEAYLILFGTGIRNAASVYVEVENVNNQVPTVVYAGPQTQYPGLDQVNVLLPASLAGSGCVDLAVNADLLMSNTVYVCIK